MNIQAKTILKKFLNYQYLDSLILFFIVIVSFIIRYIGLKFSFPLLTHTDEFAIIDPVVRMTQNNTFNPNTFYRPDQILYFLNFIYLNAISFFQTGKNLSFSIQIDQYAYFFYSRILIAIFGSLIPVVAFKIGKESEQNFSLPAALIFAFFPAYVFHSHYITPDIPITFFTLLIILLSIRYIKDLNVKYLYLASFFCAVNTAEKYPGLLSFGIIIVSIILAQIKIEPEKLLQRLKNIVFSSGKFFIVYLFFLYLVAPNLFIEYGQVTQFILNEAGSTHLGADNLGWLGNARYYVSEFLRQSNLLIDLFALIGVFGLIKYKRNYSLLYLYGVLYWIILSKLSLHWERWALPMYISPLLLAAYGYFFLRNNIFNKKLYKSIISGLFLVSILMMFIFSFSTSVRLTFTDTRVLALQFCNSKGINQDNAIYENYTPFSPALRSGNFQYLSDQDNSREYIILSSYMYDRYYAESLRYKEQINYYEKIKEENTLIKSFRAPQLENSISAYLENIFYYIRRVLGQKLPDRITGPTILIYKVN